MKDVKLRATSLKISQQWDEDVGGLVATIKLEAKVSPDDIMKLAYLQSIPTPLEVSLGSDQMPLKLQVDNDGVMVGDEKE